VNNKLKRLLGGSNVLKTYKKIGNTEADQEDDVALSKELSENINLLSQQFSYPKNNSLIIREFLLPITHHKCSLIFLESVSDTDLIEKRILQPLIESNLENSCIKDIKDFLSVKQLHEVSTIEECVEKIISGKAILLLEYSSIGLALSTSKVEHRSIEKPQSENVIKGPNESFIESLNVNMGLIRKSLRTKHLVSETVYINNSPRSDIRLLYHKEIANEELIENVKNRLNEITTKHIESLPILEQHIEERPYSLVPTVLYTERPDRVISFLLEGHVAILMEGSPSALVTPVTFWSFFHTAEDTYHRWAYGNFIRLIRLFAFFVALFTPSIYIAVTNFHREMIPTDLLLAIAGTREMVPFPAIIEVLMMEVAFELLREAGIRVPTPIGPTIGIVGALILGQAAVDANIISPILVIVVAITGLASFAIPDISFSFMIRISRFLFLLVSAMFGFLGFSILVTMVIAYLATIKSFEVPFLAPMAPHYRSSKDMIIRPPVWKQWLIPKHLKPKATTRKKIPEGSSNQ
jgi:spore germination protein KA